MKELISYFRSGPEAYAFALLHMEGQPKMQLLEIHGGHYKDRKLADKWHDEMNASLRLLRDIDLRDEALSMMRAAYNEMTAR